VDRPIEVIKIVEVLVDRIIDKPFETIRTVDRIVEMPVEVYRNVETIVDRPVEVFNVVEKIVEKIVEVPVERIVEVTKIVEKIVERIVEKPVEVVTIVEKFIDRPVEVFRTVDRIVEKIVERPVEVIKVVDRVVEKLVERTVQVENTTYLARIRELEAELGRLRATSTKRAAIHVVAEPTLDLGEATRIVGTQVRMDDLKVVEGIGPKVEEVLHRDGIMTWKQLSNMQAERIKQLLVEAGPNFRILDPTTWPEQGGLLAQGRWVEFKDLTARLTAGRR
jgi:predicted flap endonuclease-1-like 5' DNA nuclease